MNIADLRTLVARGEDSRLQYKSDVRNVDALAAEMAAFANFEGGRILIGVADNGELTLAASSPKNEDRILEIIRQDPYVTTEAMGEILGITKRAVLKQVNNLKAQDHLMNLLAAAYNQHPSAFGRGAGGECGWSSDTFSCVQRSPDVEQGA